MENAPGQPKNPEIKTEELLDIVEQMEWESGHVFTYNGSEYMLLLDSEEDADTVHQGAEYHRSTMIEGWDLYIVETLPLTERKRRLFHEILETNLFDQGLEKHKAHDMALGEEIKQFGPRK